MTDRILENSNSNTSSITVNEDDAYLYVTSSKTEVMFSKSSGMLSGVKYDGKTISLNEGPRLEQAKEKFGELVHFREGDNYIIEARHTGEPVFNPRWTMHPGGWVVIENTEVPFTVMTSSNDLFFRMLTPERPAGAQQDHTSPPFPDGDLSFLCGISAIGTKFHSTDRLGPQSAKIRQWWTLQPNQRINLFFRFGE